MILMLQFDFDYLYQSISVLTLVILKLISQWSIMILFQISIYYLMKRGKRQVVQKSIFQESQHHNEEVPSETNPQTQPEFVSTIPPTPLTIYHQPLSNQSQRKMSHELHESNEIPQSDHQPSQKQRNVKDGAHYESTQKLNMSSTEIKPVKISSDQTSKVSTKRVQIVNQQMFSSEEDEKKRKIELLKQKYLKKNSQVKTSPVIQKVQIENPPNVQGQIEKSKTQVPKKVSEIKPKKDGDLDKVQIPIVESTLSAEKLADKVVEEKIAQIEDTIISSSPATQKIEIKNQPKPHFKVPPPPVAKTQKPKIHEIPPPPKKVNERIPEVQPQPPLNQLPNNSFDESQLIASSPISKPSPISNRASIPPPPVRQVKKIDPKTKNLHEMMQKRLQRQDHIGTPHFKQQKQKEISNQENAPIAAYPLTNQRQTRALLDDEYLEKQQSQYPSLQKVQIVDPQYLDEQSIKESLIQWIRAPLQAFKIVAPSKKQIILLNFEVIPSQINYKLISKNKNFTPIIQRIILQFIINNKNQLSQQQRKLANQLALEYFYGNVDHLSNQFVILLVKVGKNYIQRYKNILKLKQLFYYSVILQHKKLFLDIQLNNFVEFVLQNLEPSQQGLCWLLMISNNQKLLHELSSRLSTKSFQNRKDTIFLLLVCRSLIRTNKNVIGIYLKTIDKLAEEISRYGIGQLALSHLNELQVAEKYYQFAKQIKLKLINSMGNSQGKYDKKEHREERQKNQKEGLFGYWNKAVDKLKNATQFVERVAEKQKPKQEQKQDVVTYDPVLKRYLINGKIPQNEDGSNSSNLNNGGNSESEGVSKGPPPPPRPSRPNAPPPPANKKNRLAGTTRYA